jgi:hypothetical protein
MAPAWFNCLHGRLFILRHDVGSQSPRPTPLPPPSSSTRTDSKKRIHRWGYRISTPRHPVRSATKRVRAVLPARLRVPGRPSSLAVKVGASGLFYLAKVIGSATSGARRTRGFFGSFNSSRAKRRRTTELTRRPGSCVRRVAPSHPRRIGSRSKGLVRRWRRRTREETRPCVLSKRP